MKGIFVTGTDTGIGKTIVSAAFVCSFRNDKSVCYWKPVQTGIEEDDDTETVRRLALCKAEEILDLGFRLEKPLSPHLSARLADVKITLGKILNFLPDENDGRFFIVEGAGGILVPLNEKDLLIDLIKELEMPVLVVARSGLGTINHTLLTLRTLRAFGLKIYGVVLNGEPNRENKKAIEHFGKTRVLAEMPKFEKIEPQTISEWSEDNLRGLT